MLDTALAPLLEVWEIPGLGFKLLESGERIESVVWVANISISAADEKQWQLMKTTLIACLKHKCGWYWKPSSLELLTSGTKVESM